MISIRLFGVVYLLANWNLTQASSIPFKVTRLVPRRFGQESKALENVKPNPKCPGSICGTLYGQVPVALLAAADPCAAQDLADKLIDAVEDPKIDREVREEVIQVAKAVAGAEKNVPPDFTKTPPKLRQALYCLKEPKHKELEGIVMKQDPETKGGNEFFDPKTKQTVLLDADKRTRPRGGEKNDKGGDKKSPNGDPEDEKLGVSTKKTFNTEPNNGDGDKKGGGDGDKKGGGDDDFETDKEKRGFKGTFIDTSVLKGCSNPRIKFAPGINNRKKDEFTFIPIDQGAFSHGEALDLSIITRSSCDKLRSCKLDKDKEEEIFNKCKELSQAIGSSKKDGLGADQWNLGFGFITHYKDNNPKDKGGKR